MYRREATHQHELHVNKKFVWQNVICRYGIPRHITLDNAKYFHNAMFKELCH
jgi:hypothetical protein